MGNKNKSKGLNIQGDSNPQKTIISDANSMDKPVFSFDDISDKNFSYKNCTQEELKSLISMLNKLSKLSWDKICFTQRHGLGTEKIPQKEIKANTNMFKGDSALIFRFSGKKPMIGYRVGNVYHVVYLDREFKAYKH